MLMFIVLSLGPVVVPGVDDIVIYYAPIPGQRLYRVMTIGRAGVRRRYSWEVSIASGYPGGLPWRVRGEADSPGLPDCH